MQQNRYDAVLVVIGLIQIVLARQFTEQLPRRGGKNRPRLVPAYYAAFRLREGFLPA